jgi:biotin transport system substrate-specific component
MNKKLTIKNMALIALFAALTCVLAPLSLPIGPVPISLATLVIYLAVCVLGAWKGTTSTLVYILLGLVGLPVFSGFSGGAGKLFGPTGGYIIGYIPLAIISGIFLEKFATKWYMCLVGMILGTIACYALGTAWLAHAAHYSFKAALWAGVIPFIPGDLVKIVIALFGGNAIRKALIRAHVL